MKKTYICPSVEVVAVNQVEIIAASLGNGTTNFGDTSTGDDGEYGDTKELKDWDIWGDAE